MKNKCLTVYLAGAMSNVSYDKQVKWRDVVKQELTKTAKASGYEVKVISPVDYYNFENEIHQTEKEVMDFDLNKVRQSDMIVVNTTELNSSIGTAIELYEASLNNIPVIAYDEYGIKDLIHPWLQCCVSRTETHIVGLCEYIRDFYMYWQRREWLSIKNSELLDMISNDNMFLTVTVGNREYIIRNSKLVKTNSNNDDYSIHRTLVCGEELKGNIIRWTLKSMKQWNY